MHAQKTNMLVLKQVPLKSGRPAQALNQTIVRRLAQKEHLFCEGDPRNTVFRVEDGLIAIYKTLSDGRRQIIEFAYPGDLVGLGTMPEHFFAAQATCPTTVSSLSAASIERRAETDAALAFSLYNAVCQELNATRNLLVSVGQGSAVERLCAFLLDLQRRAANETVKFGMLRSDIADLLGMTIETVSRTLTKMRSMGLIELKQSGTAFRITDVKQLTALANE